MQSILGLVVNPKLKRPVLVGADGHHIEIFVLDEEGWPSMGSGYYDLEDDAARISGMPRSHTPDGVNEEGVGYGTSLYTALCLGAHQNAEYHSGTRPNYVISKYGVDGDGISSMPGNRSGAAERWWDQAKDARLAVEQEDETTDEGVDATSEFRDGIVGEAYGDGTVSYVNTIDIDVTKTETVDVYPWDRARSRNLIVASMFVELNGRAPESVYKIVMEDDDLTVDVEVPWILALDVRGLTLEAINLLGVLAQTAGANEEQLRGLRLRWEMSLDPSAEIRQLGLPLTANSAAQASLHEARELRQAAGWDQLASLP